MKGSISIKTKFSETKTKKQGQKNKTKNLQRQNLNKNRLKSIKTRICMSKHSIKQTKKMIIKIILVRFYKTFSRNISKYLKSENEILFVFIFLISIENDSENIFG